MIPFLKDPDLRTRRPLLFESFVETSDVEQQGAGTTTAPTYPRLRGGGPVAGASLLAPPKDYGGVRLGPYKYIAWPSGEKELYNINKDPNELNNIVKIPNFFPVRNYMHTLLTGGLDEAGGLQECSGRTCSESVPAIPLNRIELRRVRKQEKEEKREERREEREQREQERREKREEEQAKGKGKGGR